MGLGSFLFGGGAETTTTTQTNQFDPATQAAIDRARAGAGNVADIAGQGNFFLGGETRSPTELAQPFSDPFTGQVIDASKREFQVARDRAIGGAGGINQQATAAGAFGGSRQGVAEGVRLGEIDRAEQSQIAGLLSQNFNQAIDRGVSFADRQRSLDQQKSLGPLAQAQIASQSLNLGIGPTSGTQTITEAKEGGGPGFLQNVAGIGLSAAGLGLFGTAADVAGDVLGSSRRRPDAGTIPGFNPTGQFGLPTGLPPIQPGLRI